MGGSTNIYNLSGGNGGEYINDTSEHTGYFYAIQFAQESQLSAWTGNISGAVPTETFDKGDVIYGRFTSITLASGSATLLNATGPTSSGGGGAAAGFNIGSGETKSTIEARTGDPAGYITWATDTNDIYVGDGSDNLAFYTDVKD